MTRRSGRSTSSAGMVSPRARGMQDRNNGHGGTTDDPLRLERRCSNRVWEHLAALVEKWSVDELLRGLAPEFDADAEARDTFMRYAATGAGPSGLAAVMRLADGLDLRVAASTIRVPTIVGLQTPPHRARSS